MALASKLFSYLLVLVSTFMAAWGALGLLEYFTQLAPVMPLQNPAFPPGLQLMHFVAIFTSGAVFLTGYFTRWHGTPLAMVVCFTALASLCSIETLDFLTNGDRYIRFAQEVFYYVVISIYLFRSKLMQERFGQNGVNRDGAANLTAEDNL